jgi:hypothetical protein
MSPYADITSRLKVHILLVPSCSHAPSSSKPK